MSTFLFASMPIRAHTTNPLPFAARLVERGHRVLHYAGAAFHDEIRAVGAEPMPFVRAEDFGGVDLAEHWPHIMNLPGPLAIRRGFAEIFVGQAGDRCADLVDLVREHDVDAILGDGIVFGARLAAEVSGVPWASFGDGPVAPEGDPTIPPFGPALPYAPGWRGRVRNRLVGAVAERLIFGPSQRVYDGLRADLGLPLGLSVLDSMSSPMLHLQGCTPGFDYPRTSLPEAFHFVGALRPYPEVPWTPPAWWASAVADPRPLVAISQGSLRGDVTELLVPAIRAVAELDVLAVVTTGAATPADVVDALGGQVPDNVLLTPFVPYDALFAQADVFVTNGGYTGVTLAVSHGCVLVQAGMTEEKAEIARRVAFTGCGIDLRTSRPGQDAVRRAVQQVLSEPSYRVAAEAIREEMAAHDAGMEGADLLERLAATGAPVVREGSRPAQPGRPVR